MGANSIWWLVPLALGRRNFLTNAVKFSDEFNIDGRTFYPGDDPYFQAVDLWYGVTQDLEVIHNLFWLFLGSTDVSGNSGTIQMLSLPSMAH